MNLRTANMRFKRNCKVCGVEFEAIKTTQYFCCRAHFKRDYYLRNKIKLQDELAHPKYPEVECAFCHGKTSLNFDPVAHMDMFDNFACPECSVTPKMIFEHGEKRNSFHIISQMVSTFYSIVSSSKYWPQ